MVVQPGVTFEFRGYRRSFSPALHSHHGVWRWREGILLRLTDAQGQQSFGEIAPIPWFGSETLEAAIAWCQQQQCQLTAEQVSQIPNTLPACQFGLESAWADLHNPPKLQNCLANSALLPTGQPALETWRSHYQNGISTFKWKIGVQDCVTEITLFQSLMQRLPDDTRLRLDANGGLTHQQAVQWLDCCDSYDRVEYLEQPLPPDQLTTMQHLSLDYATPIALDESITTVTQLQQCYDQGWQGIAIIKPAIAGFPSRLRQVWQQYGVDGVFSSVFETAIGRQAGMALAEELMTSQRAIGFGTQHWFDPTDYLHQATAEEIWHQLTVS